MQRIVPTEIDDFDDMRRRIPFARRRMIFLPSPLDNRYTDVVSLHYRNQMIVDRWEMIESRPEGKLSPKKLSFINYHLSFNQPT